jgi:predicted anti-sigma-YlaC factor YlaD
MTHPHPDQLAAWAAGELTPTEEQALEAHVDQCDACSRQLSALAREELVFYEIGEASQQRRGSPWRLWALAAVALAAAVLLVFFGLPSAPSPDEAFDDGTAQVDLTRDCRDQADFVGCEVDANQAGLWVPGGSVPRYEDHMRACLDCGEEG